MSPKEEFNPYAAPGEMLSQDAPTPEHTVDSRHIQVTAKITFSADYLIQALTRYRAHRGIGNIPKSLQLIAIYVSVIAALSALITHQYLISLVIIIPSLLFAGRFVGDWRIRRGHQKSAFADDELTVVLSDDGYHATSEQQDVRFGWPTFSKVVHFEDGRLLVQGNQLLYWIPFRSLVDHSQQAELDSLLRSNIAEHVVSQ